jgi:hypothetical protein
VKRLARIPRPRPDDNDVAACAAIELTAAEWCRV